MAKLIPALSLPSYRNSEKGRRNIRRVNDEEVSELTSKTIREEEARKKGIKDKYALFQKTFGKLDIPGGNIGKLILDFDPKTGKELICVDQKLVEKLKPHQVEGIRFLWNACFGSLEEIEKNDGGGCILAHCMGLGKTLQVVSFVYTLLHYEKTKVKTILILSPSSTLLNWKAEFEYWLKDLDDWNDEKVYVFMLKTNKNDKRADYLKRWVERGGVMIMGYEMFTTLTKKKTVTDYEETIICALQNPGPDVVICDEGHKLTNKKSALYEMAMKIRTSRRIILSGTPLQNNLKEYYCMVQFVRFNLLGSEEEFRRRFMNPITNGQYNDSTPDDVKLMKKRTLLLHQTLEGIVQRFDHNVLKPFLPPKHEFVIYVGLSDLQAQLYEYYIKEKSSKANYKGVRDNLFQDYQTMRLIWSHPLAMKLREASRPKTLSKGASKSTSISVNDSLRNEDHKNGQLPDENELGIDFSKINISTADEKVKGNEIDRTKTSKNNELGLDFDKINISETEEEKPWWYEFISQEDFEDYDKGPKIKLLFEILKWCEQIGDKVLIFSLSIPTLDTIEYFLTKRFESSECNCKWEKNIDYFRMDGDTPNEKRMKYFETFNQSDNMRARLFLISTKTGGLGINLTAANRVILFDTSWNPSDDIQSIFRAYRLGQKQPCYIYRLVSQGTMEEKIYERQITKQSTSCRVIDEKEVGRHFTREEITKLYTFSRKIPSLNPTLKPPNDSIMAKLLREYSNLIIRYHEHDSLLENIEEAHPKAEVDERHPESIKHDSLRENVDKNYSKEKPKVPGIHLVGQTVDRIQSDWILEAISNLYPDHWKSQAFNVEKILLQVRKQLFHFYMDKRRRDEINQSFVANAHTTFKIPFQALLDIILAVEDAAPTHLRTRERETGNKIIPLKIWSKETFLYGRCNKIGIEKIEEELQRLYPEDWKNQRFQVSEILTRVRQELLKYFLRDNKKDQLNQLIVTSVFDGLVQNSALEIENQALTDVLKEVVPSYLQTRRRQLKGKSGNELQPGNMKKYNRNYSVHGKENAPIFHQNQKSHQHLCYYHATFGAKAYRCSGNDCKNYWMINEIPRRNDPTNFQ